MSIRCICSSTDAYLHCFGEVICQTTNFVLLSDDYWAKNRPIDCVVPLHNLTRENNEYTALKTLCKILTYTYKPVTFEEFVQEMDEEEGYNPVPTLTKLRDKHLIMTNMATKRIVAVLGPWIS